jgi:gamma-glutamyltranspeptidase / glutathione hydrolase
LPEQPPASADATAQSNSDTTYFTVIDREGNISSVIQSTSNNFGSNIIVLGRRFALQDRRGLFSLDPTCSNLPPASAVPSHYSRLHAAPTQSRN